MPLTRTKATWGTMENIFVRNDLQGQRTTAVPQFRRYLGGPTDHSKRPTSRQLQSTTTARTRGKNQSATVTQEHPKQSCWFLEELDEVFRPKLVTKKQWFRVRDNTQTGDLVLELDPKHKRCEWKMPRIVGTYPGNDGLVRKVRIKTRDGEYDRPIHKLCLIATKEELNAGLL